jgi:hypothetical protein
MQLLTTLLAVWLMAVTAVAQTRSVPLKNAVLQSDMNAGGFYITNAAGITDANGNPITGGGGGGTTYTLANTNATLSFYTNGSTVLLGTNVVGGTGDISATSSNNLVAGWIAADNTMSNAIMLFVDLTNDYLVAAMDLKTGFSDSTNIATAVLNASDSLFATDNGSYYSVNSDKPVSYGQTNCISMDILAYTIGITNLGSLGTNVLSVRPSGLEFGDFECDISNLNTNAASYVFPVPYTSLTNDPTIRCAFFISTPASGAAVFGAAFQILKPLDTATGGRFDVVSSANFSSPTTNTVTFSTGTAYRMAVTDFSLAGLGSAISTNGGNVGRFFIYRLGQNAADTSTKPCILHSATLNYLQ